MIEWLQTGSELVIGFIQHLQIKTTSNYSTIADSHMQQLTTAHAKPSQSAVFTVCFLVMAFNNVAPSASMFTNLLASDTVTTNSQAGGNLTPASYSSDWLNSRLVLLRTPRHDCIGNIASNISSIVVSHSCHMDRVENATSHLVHQCVLGFCCPAMGVVHTVIT
jgi:hypothetical protein